MIRLVLFSVAALALTGLAACGGDDGGEVTVDRLACDRLGTLDSYQYKSKARILTEAPEQGTPAPNAFAPFDLTWEIEADVVDQGASTHAVVTTTDAGSKLSTDVIATDGKVWWSTDPGLGYVQHAAGSDTLIPYTPSDACQSLRDFVDLSLMEGSKDEVNGIRSFKYTLEGLDPQFLASHRNFGGTHDGVTLPESYDGAVWVATDGGYASRAELSATGAYPDGGTLTVELTFELSKINDVDTNVIAPS